MSTTGPARNRVAPNGDIVAVAGRGAWMGNRGRLHEGRGTRDVVRRHQAKTWVTCLLSFRGRRVAQWEPNRYTPLFFLDEAVALAAGHRPCGECRHQDHTAYRLAWAETHRGGDAAYAKQIDAQLHCERMDHGVRHAPWDSLPDGVFVMTEHGPAVVVDDYLAVWDEVRNAYRTSVSRPHAGTASLITPPSTIDVLRAGYRVQIDDRARRAVQTRED